MFNPLGHYTRMQTLKRMYEIQDNKDKVNECNAELEEIKKQNNQPDIKKPEPETNKIVVKKEKKTKEKIPASVKNTLWSLHFENNIQGKCQCCKTEVISKNNFDCGHITSEKNGGTVHLDNLKPICRSCNSSMGTTNMNDFMTKYGFDKI
jgi:hypothetical protein